MTQTEQEFYEYYKWAMLQDWWSDFVSQYRYLNDYFDKHKFKDEVTKYLRNKHDS